MRKQIRRELAVAYEAISGLIPYKGNPRTHSKQQLRQIARSIQELGFCNPVLIDKNNTIIAGHGRVDAAKLLGMERVPTIRLENLSPDQVRLLVLADNKLALNAGWDANLLAIELQHLLTLENDFDITLTGFEIPEIDLILEEAANPSDEDDVLDPERAGPSITQSGDLWLLGKHCVLCGNALNEKPFESLMGTRKADIVFVDPPYNLVIDGNVSGKGMVRHGDFAMASGEMSDAEFVSFLTTSLGLLARFSSSGSVHFVAMDWRHMGDLLTVGKEVYDVLLNLCVWAKDNGGQGSFYRSQHELIFVFRNGKGKYRNNIQLGQYGRYRTNVWQYPGANTLSRQGDEGNLLALHPTAKPVALVADAILDCSARGDLVLDSFLGSGTTLIAAERVGRICHGIEIDPHYVDVAIKRWQRHTGNDAVHAITGKRFDEVAAEAEVTCG